MTRPRAAAEKYLLGDTCTLVRPVLADDGAGGTSPGEPLRIGPLACGFSAVSGDEATEDIVRVRGRYRLKLAVDLRDPDTDDPLTIEPTDSIEVLGEVYQVVWTPPPAALTLLRTVGLKDVY